MQSMRKQRKRATCVTCCASHVTAQALALGPASPTHQSLLSRGFKEHEPPRWPPPTPPSRSSRPRFGRHLPRLLRRFHRVESPQRYFFYTTLSVLEGASTLASDHIASRIRSPTVAPLVETRREVLVSGDHRWYTHAGGGFR